MASAGTFEAAAIREKRVGSRRAARHDEPLPQPAGELCGIGGNRRGLALVRDKEIDFRQQREIDRQRRRQIEHSIGRRASGRV